MSILMQIIIVVFVILLAQLAQDLLIQIASYVQIAKNLWQEIYGTFILHNQDIVLI